MGMEQITSEPSCAARRLLPIPGVFYGGGCSYMACRGLMMSGIEDVLLVTHGPVGCAYFSGINGYRGASKKDRPAFAGRVFSTNLSETDVIFGGEGKLARALDEAVERYRPKAVAVCATCPVGLIGDDIQQVAREAAERHGIDVLPLSCEGFKSEPGWLHGGRQILDQWVGKESRPTGPFPIHLMSEECANEQGPALRDLLRRIGYDVVCSMMGVTTYEDVRRAQDARLIVLDSGKAIDEIPLMFQERYGCGFLRIVLTGLGNLVHSLRAMAAFFDDEGLAARTEAVVAEELARIEVVRAAARTTWEGTVVGVFEDIFRSDDFAVLSCELGMDVIMIAQDYEAETYTEEGYQVHVPARVWDALGEAERGRLGLACAVEAACLPGCACCHSPERELTWRRATLDRQQVSQVLKATRPALCFAGVEERFGRQDAILRCERFLSDERGTDYAGFDGLARFARDLSLARDMAHWTLDVPAWAKEGGAS